MGLKEKISDDIKTAMKDKNKERTGVLRMLLSEIKYAEVAQSTAQALDDAAVQKVIATYAKRLTKSLQDFAGTDKIDGIQAELKIIEEYLPQKASEEEVARFIDTLLDQSDERQFGNLMKQVLGHFKGSVDGKLASELLKSKLG